MHDLELERKYQVEGRPEMLPYSQAKKWTVYPKQCISEWHPADEFWRTAGPSSHFCLECTDLLRSSWQTIAKHYPLLTEALHPSQSFSNGDRIGGAGDIYPPLPINANVSDLLRDIRDSVWSVVQGLIEDRPSWRLPPDQSVDVLADNLAKWHVDYIAGHPRPAHAWAVLQETWTLAGRVGDQASEIGPAEHPLDERCAKTIANPIDPDGPRRPCPGWVMAVQQTNGQRQAQCTSDPTHTVPLSIWSQVTAQRATHRAGITGHLLKRHGRLRPA